MAALVADYQSGMGTGDVARKYAVDADTAARWLKLKGVYRAPEPRILEEHLSEVRMLRDAGWTYAKIATQYGCSATTVFNAVKRETGA